MFAEDDIERRRAEREAADRAYNEALTALDGAVPKLPDLPHPPVAYDESQLPLLNESWRIVAEDPAAGLRGWRRRLALVLWRLAGPAFARQQAFNATLVEHLNRNVAAERATLELSLGPNGEPLEIDQFRLACNAEPSAAAWGAAQRWLAEGRRRWREGRGR